MGNCIDLDQAELIKSGLPHVFSHLGSGWFWMA